MATTYTDFIDGTALPARPVPMNDGLKWYKVRVNFATQNLDAGLSDVHQVFTIPAGYYVKEAFMRVVTAAPTNATCDLGYGASNQWGNALALDSTAGTVLGGTQYGVPTYFSSSDTVDITATTDTADVNLTSGVVDVVIAILKA